MHQPVEHVVADVEVPAVRETSAGMPSPRGAERATLTGSVLKQAAGPPGMPGRPIGALPALSGIRASSQLIVTLSSEMPARPPAWPAQITGSGGVQPGRSAMLNAHFSILNGVTEDAGGSTATVL
jgi:hypothetical protein